jgi:hypothetical protein
MKVRISWLCWVQVLIDIGIINDGNNPNLSHFTLVC